MLIEQYPVHHTEVIPVDRDVLDTDWVPAPGDLVRINYHQAIVGRVVIGTVISNHKKGDYFVDEETVIDYVTVLWPEDPWGASGTDRLTQQLTRQITQEIDREIVSDLISQHKQR